MKRELSKIGELATYVNGYAFKPSDWSLKGRPIIRIQDLTGNDYQTNYYEGTLDERYKIKKGDLLISWSASIGIYEWEKEDAWLNQHIFKVVFDKGVDIEKKYFQYAVGNALKKVSGLIHGSTMKHLTKSAFDSIQVPLYSVDEQQKIVQRLEAMQRSVNISKKEIEKLDTLVKSRFIEMFGDAPLSCMMKNVCKIITDGTHQPPKFVREGIPFIFVSNIVQDHLTYNAEKFIDNDTYNELIKRTPIEIGDVLLSTVGSYGHAAIVESERKFLFQRHIAYLKPDQDKINSRFMHSLILSDGVQRQIESKVKGIAQKTLNLLEIKSLQIPLPSLGLQNQFAAFVEQVDRSKSVLQKLLEKQELLRSALMQEYFG